MYGDICPLMVEVKSLDSVEECREKIGGLAKYGMRIVL